MRPVGTEPEAGFYRARLTRKGPWVPVRIIEEQALWVCLVNGEPTKGSGASDPFDVPFLLYNWPLHPISEFEYLALVDQHDAAKRGTPLADPNAAVDLRNSRSLM